MRTLKVIIAIAAAALLSGCGDFIHGKATADAAVTHFHDLYNQAKLDAIWNEAGADFRNSMKKEKYDEFMGAVERKLGKVTSTSSAGWNVSTMNLKTRARLTQNTTFEHGQGTESFAFALDGTNAVLVSYNIQSMDLVVR